MILLGQIPSMASLLFNLGTGIRYRLKKMFYRPYSVFDIGWMEEKMLKHQHNKTLRHHLYKNKYKVTFNDGPTFLLSIHELFVCEYYKFKTTAKQPLIIDCGSYIGTSILFFKDNYPNAKIIGFEPDSANFALLSENLANWNLTDTTIHNAAIWVNNGTISFKSAGNMSSRIEAGSNVADSSHSVSCMRLQDLLQEEVDFLKIDIEGAEHEVLKDCSDYLGNVKNLFVEYHGKFSEMFKLNDILDILLKNNFKYYIKEGIPVYTKPFWERDKKVDYDLLLNISAFRD